MSVYLTIPSARPIGECVERFEKWQERGYKLAIWRDTQDDFYYFHEYHGLEMEVGIFGAYPGYSRAVNELIRVVMMTDPEADWMIIGGDDTTPDANFTAEEIARQTSAYFGIKKERHRGGVGYLTQTGHLNPNCVSTFGVMQPTGDRAFNGSIDTIAGSAWIGREFARRMYQGNGPLWHEYTRFFMDNELKLVAEQYQVFQQRRDLIHLHRHYMRETDAIDSPAIYSEIPAHLKAQEVKWKAEQDIFNRRKHARPTPFPGSEPIV